MMLNFLNSVFLGKNVTFEVSVLLRAISAQKYDLLLAASQGVGCRAL